MLERWQQLALSLIFLPLLATGCSNDDSVTGIATTLNVERSYSAFAMSGTAPGLPAGYYFVTETLVRPQQLTNGNLNFELAFDIEPDGKVSLIPASKAVLVPAAAAPTVGLQQSPVNFDELTRAPDRNYVYDSVMTGRAGDTFVVQLYNSGCPFGNPYYAKIALDTVITAERRIAFRTIVNRNCGFRGLVVGLPTN